MIKICMRRDFIMWDKHVALTAWKKWSKELWSKIPSRERSFRFVYQLREELIASLETACYVGQFKMLH